MARGKSDSETGGKPQQVKIFTLGRFVVEIDGVPLRFGTKAQRKPLELLKVIIALEGESVSVEILIEALWPESEGDRAYNAFGTTLNRLRTLIGRDSLHLQDGRLTLDSHYCKVDSLEYTGLLTLAAQAIKAGDGLTAWGYLEEVLALYQGPFLEGDYDPPEILSAREKLHSLLLRHVGELGQFLEKNGQSEKAISLYQKGLELDDLAEDFYRPLIQCYRQQGRLAEALAVYQRCQNILQAKMEVEPSPEMERIYQSLLTDQERKSSPPKTIEENHPPAPAQDKERPAPPEPSKTGGERRQATVVFSNLSGYTAMNDQLDPEEVDSLMNKIKGAAVGIVESHGGIVNLFVGGEGLALFGIPTAHEDDPRRAVRATLNLHEFVRGISPEVEKRIGQPLRMNSGISTGLIVTRIRDDLEGKHGITGDTVTVGAQLAKRAKADEILLSAETYNLAAPYFNTSPLKPVKMKGKSQAQEAYRVEGESSVETRIEAAKQRGFTPFTGRGLELETLRSNLDKATAGEGRFVTISGEAGVGKSRLLYEFRHSLDPDRVMVLEGRCQFYGSETPYLPFINALQRGLHLLEGDTPAQMLEKSVTNILAVNEALEQYLPLYLHLQSIQSEDYPLPKHLQGPEFAPAMQEALSAIFTLVSLKQPLVVVFEDWHWADEASQGALNYLLGVLASHPLMVVVLYRPDFSPPWGSPGHHTSIALNPMERQNSEAIVAAALHTIELPDGLARLIHQRTGGNPFFIEEVCGALVDEGSLSLKKGRAELTRPLENITLPNTVQAVIQTRLDRLNPQARETLGLASVIGREFTRGILAKVIDDPARLSTTLEELKALEIIQQTSVVPEAAYRFNHVLTQEVTYNTLLLQRRRELHRKVGLAIEDLYADRIGEQSEILAHHFCTSENWEKAVKFGRLAAEKAQSLSQYQQAISNYEKSISWLCEIPEDNSRQKIIAELYWKIGNNLTNLGDLVDAQKAYHSAQVAASSLDEPHLLGKIQIASANAYGYTGEYSTANKLFQEGLKQIEVSKDEYSIAWAKHTLGTSYLGPGYWKKAEPLISEALRIYEKHGRLIEYSFNYNYGTVGYAHSGYCLAVMGKVERALENFKKGGTPELQEPSNLMTKMVYISWLGLFAGLVGDNPVEAIGRANQILQVAEKSDSPFQILGALAAKSNILMGIEDFEGVKVSCDRALKAIEGKNIRTGHVGNIQYNLAWAHLELGDQDAAIRHFKEGLPMAEMSPHWWGPRYEFLKGLWLTRKAKPVFEQAEALFESSATKEMEVGAYVPAAQTRYHLARMLTRKGETTRAREMLTGLRKQFKQWGIPVWEKKCREALAEAKAL